MNAVTISREEDFMPADENSSDSINRSVQLAELRSDVRHLQSDVMDLKTEVRTVNQKIDSLRDKIEAVGKSVDSAKVWGVLVLSSVVVQLLYVIAHGLKWL